MKLSSIQPMVQQIAETISSVLELDTEIVDEELIILGGTGKYAREVGKQEENGLTNGPFLYGRILRNGKSHIVEDTASEDYDPDSVKGEPDELSEICSPIRKDDNILGVIGLVAFSPEQKRRLLQKKAAYLTFIQRMAFFLASLVSEGEAKLEKDIIQREMTVALSGLEQGVMLIDEVGRIKYCNEAAPRQMMQNNGDSIIGKNVSEFWPFSPILRVLDSNQKFIEHVEVTGQNRQLVITARPIVRQNMVTGAVVYLQEKAYNKDCSLSVGEELYSFNRIIGRSSALNKLKEQALRISPSNATILLTGESGTGKELIAKAIHGSSLRSNGPFVKVNCAAIPENLLESDFFGYEGGSFTGAWKEGKAGKFERARGGTLFLDEIGDLAHHLQVKLLHVLESKTMERVGGSTPIKIDVRVIAATNRNLEEMMRMGEFREDLYFRLSVIPLHLPPLRERKDDLMELIEFFLQKQAAELGKSIKGLSPEALSAFQRHHWPGNARELENAVAYCVNMETEDMIQPGNLPLRLRQEGEPDSTRSLDGSIKEQERAFLLACLKDRNKYKTRTELARSLNISRTTLYRKLKRLGIK